LLKLKLQLILLFFKHRILTYRFVLIIFAVVRHSIVTATFNRCVNTLGIILKTSVVGLIPPIVFLAI